MIFALYQKSNNLFFLYLYYEQASRSRYATFVACVFSSEGLNLSLIRNTPHSSRNYIYIKDKLMCFFRKKNKYPIFFEQKG